MQNVTFAFVSFNSTLGYGTPTSPQYLNLSVTSEKIANTSGKMNSSDNLSSTGYVTTILIIGLGNPGEEYSQTRHNIGFITVDELAKQYRTSFSIEEKFHCEICEASRENQKLIFVKPNTFMNLSGKSALPVKMYFNISHRNIIVIHDDIDLDLGRIKIKMGGNHGGHNGLKSLDQFISNQYHRIRVGIGRPLNNQSVIDYVLQNFQKSEHEIMKEAVDKITDNFHLLLDGKVDAFRNKVANAAKVQN